ncbi:hypothetical protein Amal_02875 [Acetobacter malorum]|uniref:Uncharacterized protein n=1 Tax=Acetobacter malorum TaxID=178901 RepID=A0A177G8Y7_9PROT|nr:hypothetical protein Amal_02875 [Acetobacter malorum]
MGFQPFGLCQSHPGRANTAQGIRATGQEGCPFHKVKNRQAGCKAGCAGGRQNMVRAAHVIPHGFRAEAAKENRARVPYMGKQGFRIIHHQFQMFRGQTVGQSHRFFQIFDDQNRAVPLPACAGNGGAGQGFQLGCDGFRHFVGKSCIRRDECRLSQFIMLGLSQ